MWTFFPALKTPCCCPVVQCILRPAQNDETASSCCFSMAWPRGCHIQLGGQQIRAEHLSQWGQHDVLLSLPRAHKPASEPHCATSACQGLHYVQSNIHLPHATGPRSPAGTQLSWVQSWPSLAVAVSVERKCPRHFGVPHNQVLGLLPDPVIWLLPTSKMANGGCYDCCCWCNCCNADMKHSIANPKHLARMCVTWQLWGATTATGSKR